ncbi:MAG: hypothetical protein V7K57_10975 [Nostoc sp.]
MVSKPSTYAIWVATTLCQQIIHPPDESMAFLHPPPQNKKIWWSTLTVADSDPPL